MAKQLLSVRSSAINSHRASLCSIDEHPFESAVKAICSVNGCANGRRAVRSVGLETIACTRRGRNKNCSKSYGSHAL